MHSNALRIDVLTYQALKSRLQTEYPHIDEESLTDTLEEITNLQEMIATVIRSALVDEALYAGLCIRVEEMRERLARIEQRGAKKRELALDAMTEVGLTKLEQPDFTASTRAGSPSLVVVTEEAIPEDYSLPQPPWERSRKLVQRPEARRATGELTGVAANGWSSNHTSGAVEGAGGGVESSSDTSSHDGEAG